MEDRRSLLVFAGLFAIGCGRAPIIAETDGETEETGTTAADPTTGDAVDTGTSTGQQVDVDTATTDGDTTTAMTVGATDDTTAGATDDTTTGDTTTGDTTTGDTTGDTTTDGTTTDASTDTTSGGPCDGVTCEDDEICIAGVCFPVAATTGGECTEYLGEGTWPVCVDSDDCGDEGECLGINPGETSCVYSPCTDACDCPAPPPTGDALPVCDDVAGPMGPDGLNDCYLSCESGETCPDGMVCAGGLLCVHSNAIQVQPYEACAPPDLMCGDGMLCVYGDIDVNSSCLQEDCMTEADCPPPPPGGTVACADVVPNGGNECYLDCADGTPCPAAWECFSDFACLQPLG